MATEAQLSSFIQRMRGLGHDDDAIRQMAIAMGMAKPTAARPAIQIPFTRLEAAGAIPAQTPGEVEVPEAGGLGEAVSQTVKQSLGSLASGGQQVVAGAGRGVQAVGKLLEESVEGKPGFLPAFPGSGPAGRLLQAAGEEIALPAEERAAKLAPEALRADFWQSFGQNPVKTLALHGIHQVPQVMGVIASGGIRGGMAGAAFMLEAGAAYREALAEGASPREAAQAAGLTGLANMFLEVKGVSQILKTISGPKQGVARFFTDIGKAILAEGSTEGLQEYVSMLTGLAVYAGERGLSLNDLRELFSFENLKRAGAASLIGAVTGGGVTTVGSLGPARQAARLRQVAELPEKEVKPSRKHDPLERGKADAEQGVLEVPEDVQEATEYLAGQEEASVVGRPDLASPTTTEAERDLTTAVQQEREQRSPANVRHDDEVVAEATQRLDQRGEEAELQRFLADGARSDSDVAVAKILIQRTSQRALETGQIEDLSRARRATLKYYEEGTEAARAFRFRRDFTMPPAERQRQALRDALLYPSPKLKLQLDNATTEEEVIRAEEAYAREIGDVRRRVQEVGIDLDALLDPAVPITQERLSQMALVSRIANAERSDLGDRILEYWRNAILSAPTTQMANLSGNTIFLLGEFYLQRPVEELLNLVVKDPAAAQPGEVVEATRGLFERGVVQSAWQAARRSFATEAPIWSEEFGDTGGMKVETIRGRPGGVSIPGTKGRVIRTPQRFLLAADEFAKTLIYNMALHTLAVRVARANGEDVQALVHDPPPEMVQAAHQEALYLTFQTPLGKVGQKAIALRREIRPLTFLLPFIVTPGNIVKVSIKKSPLGIINLLHKYGKHSVGSVLNGKDAPFVYKKNEQIHDWAEQILAWGTVMVLMGLSGGGDDEDVPWVTGSADPRLERRELQYRAAPPQSIRLGQNWYSYARLEPLAFPLTFIVDSVRGLRAALREEGDVAGEWERLYSSVASLVRDKTFMRGLSDLMELIELGARGNVGRHVTDWATNFVTSWVPNIIKSAARASSPYLREARVTATDKVSWSVDAGQVLAYKSLPAGGAPLRHDLWGRPIRLSDPTGRPATDFAYRLLSPARTQRAELTAPDRLLLNYNNAHPRDGFYPRTPRNWFRKGGKVVRMTRAEYQEFVSRAGKMAHAWMLDDIEAGLLNPDKPDEIDIKRVKKNISDARALVKAQMFGER